MFEKPCHVNFLGEQTDRYGTTQYCFEGKIPGYEYSNLLFNLSKSGRLTMSSKYFQDLPRDLREQLISIAKDQFKEDGKMFENSFKVVYLGEQEDQYGRPQYCFEAKVPGYECSSLLFNLGESGHVTMSSKYFQELPKDLREEIIHVAWDHLS